MAQIVIYPDSHGGQEEEEDFILVEELSVTSFADCCFSEELDDSNVGSVPPQKPFFTVEVVDKPVNNQDLDEKERKRLSNQRYYGKHRGQIKEKRRVLAQDTNINAHEKFMNKKRYHENKPKPMKNYIDIEHQSECKIGICATFVHPSKIKKRKRNQRYYNTHKERLMEKRRTATDESAKSHDRFMSKRRYFLAKNMQFEDADHQMMCNIGICAGFVPSLMPKRDFS